VSPEERNDTNISQGSSVLSKLFAFEEVPEDKKDFIHGKALFSQHLQYKVEVPSTTRPISRCFSENELYLIRIISL